MGKMHGLTYGEGHGLTNGERAWTDLWGKGMD